MRALRFMTSRTDSGNDFGAHDHSSLAKLLHFGPYRQHTDGFDVADQVNQPMPLPAIRRVHRQMARYCLGCAKVRFGGAQ